MEDFNLKGYLAENKLLKEEVYVDFEDDLSEVTVYGNGQQFTGVETDDGKYYFIHYFDDVDGDDSVPFLFDYLEKIGGKMEIDEEEITIEVDYEDLRPLINENKLIKENNKKAIEFVKDKWFKLFDKNGIKLKDYRIGGKVDGDSTLILFPKTDKDFESISRSLETTYKGNDAYSFKNQKPFEVAGKQYKIVYDINKMDGGINITPTTFDVKENRLEGLIREKLCKKGEAYRKRRMAAGEKSSAYLSGRAVKVCKGQMSGRKKKKTNEIEDRVSESLRDWFKKEDWVRIDTQGNISGKCGTMKNKKVPSRCLPRKKAQSLTKAERKASAQKKKREGKKGKQFVKNPK